MNTTKTYTKEEQYKNLCEQIAILESIPDRKWGLTPPKTDIQADWVRGTALADNNQSWRRW